uniref:Small ribosomal subunit protein uS3c n=1 Tax=Toxarium undulatum TaxID=210620 RepID=A0A1D8D9P0_9STRA|nr:ribosomal protein S3 [Toxarium undulatum]AOS86652.1 ribosomal protein S3 [Toxarium undulatum]
MGQKTHPLGFRLGITKKHKSIWYSNFNNYANILKEDDQIRLYLKKFSRTSNISNIQINRLGNNVQINIETGRPGELIGKNKNLLHLKDLLKKIKSYLPVERQVTIKIIEINVGNLTASSIADFMVNKLEDRVAFRRAIREALQIAQKGKVKGIKIQVSGRLNGAEIARSEWIREGRVPLQTLEANIDYSTKEANTIYGVLGIKVWLFSQKVF